MSKKTPEMQEIDAFTEKLTLRMSADKKRQLFQFAAQNNTTVSEMVRKILDSNTK
jgi:hypothetical protein